MAVVPRRVRGHPARSGGSQQPRHFRGDADRPRSAGYTFGTTESRFPPDAFGKVVVGRWEPTPPHTFPAAPRHTEPPRPPLRGVSAWLASGRVRIYRDVPSPSRLPRRGRLIRLPTPLRPRNNPPLFLPKATLCPRSSGTFASELAATQFTSEVRAAASLPPRSSTNEDQGSTGVRCSSSSDPGHHGKGIRFSVVIVDL